MQTTIKNTILTLLVAATITTLTGCYDEGYDSPVDNSKTIAVKLTVQTRAATDHEGYGIGSEWENNINFSGHDFRIYFFTYDNKGTNESKGGELIAELYSTNTKAEDTDDYTTEYTIDGNVLETITSYSDFRVVVLANWGTSAYPDVTVGQTTIDDLCENGSYARFTASNFLSTNGSDSSHNIPFYGVQEFNGVTWDIDGTTDLTTTGINMLRALAKVEVVLEDTSLGEVESVTINRYNATGYCAPTGVYLASDYYHKYNYADDFTSALHLVGGANDSDEKTHEFNQVDDSTWVIYLPEYDNMGTDYSSISVKLASVDTARTIYFGEYENGVCDAYESPNSTTGRFNIFRYYYYLFTIYDMNSTTRSAGSTPSTQAEVKYGW